MILLHFYSAACIILINGLTNLVLEADIEHASILISSIFIQLSSIFSFRRIDEKVSSDIYQL